MPERLSVIALSRERFHDEIWFLTAQELRIRYAISPYALQMICQKYRIPEPGENFVTEVEKGLCLRENLTWHQQDTKVDLSLVQSPPRVNHGVKDSTAPVPYAPFT